MKKTIVIFHRIDYEKVNYHEVIDHFMNEVIYMTESTKNDIPSSVPHTLVRFQRLDCVESIICYLKRNYSNISEVFALSEYNLITAEIIRSVLNINSTSSSSTYNCRDKQIMKTCIENAGIRTASGQTFRSLAELLSFEKIYTRKKFIIKPVNGASSFNTISFNSFEKLLEAKEELASIDFSRTYLCEEFIEGEIYHFDGLVHDDKVLFSIPSKYIGSCLGFSKGKALASIQLDELEFYYDWVCDCIRAVGLCNGAFHLEGILNEKGSMYFLEIGNRSGGAGVVDCSKYLLGVNLMQEELKIKMGLDTYEFTPPLINSTRYGWFVLPKLQQESLMKAQTFLKDIKSVKQFTLNSKVISNNFSYDSTSNQCTGVLKGSSSSTIEETGKRLLQTLS